MIAGAGKAGKQWEVWSRTGVTGFDCQPRHAGLFSLAVIDIHCHILPGLDDGPDSIDISIAMAEMAIADGIAHVIGTPHAHSDHVFDPVKIKERRDELQQRFEGRLILATGCDFPSQLRKPRRYSL